MELVESPKPRLKFLQSNALYSNELLTNSRYSFLHFFYGIYAPAVMQVEQIFEPGAHLDEWCYRLQANKRTATIAPRLHLKTTTDLGYIAWQLFKMKFEKWRNYDEIAFMSYLEDGAQYQLRRLKRYISFIPFFEDYKNMTIATGLLNYNIDGREFYCEPMGILSFKRGKHPRIMICDDILKDPKSKRMTFDQLDEVKRIFTEQVDSMPREELHVLGTPQAKNDLFSTLEMDARYQCKRYDAIVDEDKQIALWPEVFPWPELMSKRNGMGEKSFNKEFRGRPASGEEGFFKEKVMDAICKPRLKNYDLMHPVKLRELTYGGMDIGKKTHPSHITILGVDRKGRLVQVHDKWMDGWDYKDQIEYCRQAIKIFNVEKLIYDDTRAEFEGFKENETLPDEMEGLAMTGKSVWELASSLDTMVTAGKLWLIKCQRSKSQLLNVDNDLKAPVTDEGHSDNFTSLCLAIRAFEIGSSPLVREL